MALILEGSRPDCLLAEDAAVGRDKEFLDPSTLSLFMASLSRLDIGSWTYQYMVPGRVYIRERTFVEIRGREHTRHGMTLSHLLQNLNEESNLYLRSLLQECIQSGGSFGLAQNPEPLLDSAQLIFEVLVQSCRSHLLQRGLVLVNLRDPLLRDLVGRIPFQAPSRLTCI